MLFFNDVFIGHFVILCILLFLSLCPIFKKIKKTDTYSLLAPCAFLLIILHILVFGLQIFSIIILILAFIVLCMNGPALYRLTQNLRSRRYSNGFYTVSIFLALITVACLSLLIIFMPLSFNKENQIKTEYTGTFAQGFVEKTNFFSKTSLVVSEWRPEDAKRSMAVVYLSSIGTTTYDSSLRLSGLADLGIPVIGGDFYVNQIITPFSEKLNMQEISADNSIVRKKEYELEALLEIAKDRYKNVVVIADGILQSVAVKVAVNNNFVVDVISYDENSLLKEYYGRNQADVVGVLPVEGFLLNNLNWAEYSRLRDIAVNKNPHIVFANFVAEKIKEVQ